MTITSGARDLSVCLTKWPITIGVIYVVGDCLVDVFLLLALCLTTGTPLPIRPLHVSSIKMAMIISVIPYHLSSLAILRSSSIAPASRVILVSITQVLAILALVLSEPSILIRSSHNQRSEKSGPDGITRQASKRIEARTGEMTVTDKSMFTQPRASPMIPDTPGIGVKCVYTPSVRDVPKITSNTTVQERPKVSFVSYGSRVPDTIDYVARNSQASKEALLLFELHDGEITPVAQSRLGSRTLVIRQGSFAPVALSLLDINGEPTSNMRISNEGNLQTNDTKRRGLLSPLNIPDGGPRIAMQWANVDFEGLHARENSSIAQPISPHFNLYSATNRSGRYASPR